jgi:GC-rich sequence DNA-binding factor
LAHEIHIFKDQDPFIPTTSAIAAAKAKRDHLRKHGAGAEDSGFISLDVAKMPSKKGDSRLVREEDEIGEGEDGMLFHPASCLELSHY